MQSSSLRRFRELKTGLLEAMPGQSGVRYTSGDFEVVGTNRPIPSVGATITRRREMRKVIDELLDGHPVLRAATAPATRSADGAPGR